MQDDYDRSRRQDLGLRARVRRKTQVTDTRAGTTRALGILILAHILVVAGYAIAALCCHPQP